MWCCVKFYAALIAFLPLRAWKVCTSEGTCARVSSVMSENDAAKKQKNQLTRAAGLERELAAQLEGCTFEDVAA